MQFVKVFLGSSGWSVTVYKLYAVCMGVHVQPVMCVSQFRIAARRPRRVKFCCVV